MNTYELSKSEKKKVRQIIEKGLQIEFANGLKKVEKVINDWKRNGSDNREAYHKMYDTVKNYDKHIAQRYDNMGGAQYIFVVAELLHDKIIDDSDLEELSEGTIARIFLLAGRKIELQS